MSLTFDSNVLIYAADRSAGARHDRASLLVETALRLHRGLLTLQALAEFYSVSTRKLKARRSDVQKYLTGLRAALPVYPAAEADLDAAMLAEQVDGLSFWDAMLWATAKRAGARYLITEDFQDGRVIGGVTFVDPFNAANDRLLERALPPVS